MKPHVHASTTKDSTDVSTHEAQMLQKTQRSLPIALLRARETLMSRFRPLLAAQNVTEQQWRVLRVLYEAGPLDATQISDSCCILAPSLTRIFRNLEQRALITRKKDAADARKLVLAITPRGKALIQVVTPESKKIYQTLESEFGTERIEKLLDTLEDLSNLE